jgi:hypothetical protein
MVFVFHTQFSECTIAAAQRASLQQAFHPRLQQLPKVDPWNYRGDDECAVERILIFLLDGEVRPGGSKSLAEPIERRIQNATR